MTWIPRTVKELANVSLTRSNGYAKSTKLVVLLAITVNNFRKLTKFYIRREHFAISLKFSIPLKKASLIFGSMEKNTFFLKKFWTQVASFSNSSASSKV